MTPIEEMDVFMSIPKLLDAAELSQHQRNCINMRFGLGFHVKAYKPLEISRFLGRNQKHSSGIHHTITTALNKIRNCKLLEEFR